MHCLKEWEEFQLYGENGLILCVYKLLSKRQMHLLSFQKNEAKRKDDYRFC